MDSVIQARFKDAIHYCEVGIACFMAFAILGIIGYAISSRPIATSGWEVSNIGSVQVYTPAFIAVSLVLAWATRQRLVIPLKLGNVPRHARGWTAILGTLALVFGLGFGTIAFFLADSKIKSLQLVQISNLSPAFS